MSSQISFPGLSIPPFTVNPIALTVGSIEIRWYGIIIVLGIIAGFSYAVYRAKQSGLSLDDMLDYVLVALPLGIVCARLYYVLFYNDGSYKTFHDIVAIWEGGLAIYGGVLGGLLGIFLVSRKKKNSLRVVLDCFAPGVLIGQIFGRWGNFFNAEAYGTLDHIDFPFIGRILTPRFEENYPFRMVIENNSVGKIAVHPTFLYESVWNLLGFVLIHRFFLRKRFDGEVALWYFTWYGFGRFFIEGMRGDSLMFGSFRVSQVLALLLFCVGVVLIIIGRRKAKQKDKILDGYITQFEQSDESDGKEEK